MFHTVRGMGYETQARPAATGQEYAALRQTGTSPTRARVELGIAPGLARRLETSFRVKSLKGGDVQSPRFARHDEHVALVMAQGGFCAFSERRIGREGAVVCLPMRWPK
jgi:hypothetical protein